MWDKSNPLDSFKDGRPVVAFMREHCNPNEDPVVIPCLVQTEAIDFEPEDVLSLEEYLAWMKDMASANCPENDWILDCWPSSIECIHAWMNVRESGLSWRPCILLDKDACPTEMELDEVPTLDSGASLGPKEKVAKSIVGIAKTSDLKRLDEIFN